MRWMFAHKRAKLAAEAEQHRLEDRKRLDDALRPYANAVASIHPRSRPIRVPSLRRRVS